MNRPTDTSTGKVVAEWMGEPYEHTDDGWCSCFTRPGDDTGIILINPCDCHETAVALLHETMNRCKKKTAIDISADGEMWVLFDWDQDSEIARLPITGPAFRYAVVELAAQVMEIKDD